MDTTFLKTAARPHQKALLFAMALMLANALVSLSLPWLLGQAVGGVLQDIGVGFGLVLTLLAALAAMSTLRVLSNWWSSKVAAELSADLHIQVFDHVQHLPLSYHNARRQGDTLSLMTTDVERLSDFISRTLISIPQNLFLAAGAVIMMALIDPTLALAVPLLVPLFYFVMLVVGRMLRGLSVRHRDAWAEVLAQGAETLDMLPAVKTFAREQIEKSRFGSQVTRATDLRLKEARIYAALGPVTTFITGAAAVLLLYFAGEAARNGGLTAAELVSFLAYAAFLTQPVAALSLVYGQVQTARGATQRLSEALHLEKEPGYQTTSDLLTPKGEIRIEDLHFTYPNRPGILRGITCTIDAGETVALKGPNGSGKSSLVSLLLRLYEPDQGRILIDGTDISTVSAPSLRRHIGYVPQRALLFNGTIRDNIRFGLDTADQPAIEQAAKLAQAHNFITDLPSGYDTLIGDNGIRLSGGQRQRIALARALLKNPAILILDEATSMYDDAGEAAFIQDCATALANRTVILITHRPASLSLADRVLHLEKGTLTGSPGRDQSQLIF